jgi:hypothetical protein
MADSDTSELIEQWARRALEAAEIELPDDASVSAEKGGDGQGGDGYTLSVDLPKGEGEQQTANSIQAALAQAVEDDPTLGGLFEKVSVSPAGVDVVGTSQAGVRSMIELTAVPREQPDEEDDESEERDDTDDSDDADEDDSDEDAASDDKDTSDS